MKENSGRSSLVSTFRQLVSEGRIKFNLGLVTIEPKEDDLRRVHNILSEIDDCRVLYRQDIRPEFAVYILNEVKRVRDYIRSERQGLWADLWAREVVQTITHEINEFITALENNVDPDTFVRLVSELRIKIWTISSELVIAFGAAVKPLHLPQEIFFEVKKVQSRKT